VSRNIAYDLDTIAMASYVRATRPCPSQYAIRIFASGSNTACFSVAPFFRVSLALLLFFFLPVAPPLVQAQNAAASNEYRSKASFLAAFPQFIDWPEVAFPTPKAPFLLCVIGDFSFGTSLAETTQTISIHGRRVELRWAHKEQELRACHILFVSRSESKSYEKIFKALEGASVLTVGETPNFLSSGGAIDFLIEGDRLQFEVSMVAAEDAHLRISSNMLALARHVIVRPQPAKSPKVTQPSLRTIFSTPLLHGDGAR